MRLPHPDWLFHRLLIAGPAEPLAALRAAAAGPGTVPWQLDPDRMEEDWFHRLLGAGALSQHGAGVLARQLRDAVVERHRIAAENTRSGRACPFDLHALVPVPATLLALGPDDHETAEWLWSHWGTTEPLRRVTLAEDGDASPTALRITFWAADWTPWRALSRLRDEWPELSFTMQPEYGRHDRP